MPITLRVDSLNSESVHTSEFMCFFVSTGGRGRVNQPCLGLDPEHFTSEIANNTPLGRRMYQYGLSFCVCQSVATDSFSFHNH